MAFKSCSVVVECFTNIAKFYREKMNFVDLQLHQGYGC